VSLRIAVLFHENYRKYRRRHDYLIGHLAGCWREAGHAVTFLFGAGAVEPADVLIVHVDLSVVPEKYLEFARRYPVVINGAISDVRKSSFSVNLLRQDDRYDGPVIVKSDLNYAGIPERLLSQSRLKTSADHVLSRVPAIRARRRLRFGTPADYRLYDSLHDVPAEAFRSPDIVVEKFLPEMDDGQYCLRLFHCLGDRDTCVLNRSTDPIVRAGNKMSRAVIEPHPDVVALRRQLNLDYGKIDYVVREGRAVVFDVNKTPGHGRHIAPHGVERFRRLAAGLSSFMS
jgi:hypothetical protein